MVQVLINSYTLYLARQHNNTCLPLAKLTRPCSLVIERNGVRLFALICERNNFLHPSDNVRVWRPVKRRVKGVERSVAPISGWPKHPAASQGEEGDETYNGPARVEANRVPSIHRWPPIQPPQLPRHPSSTFHPQASIPRGRRGLGSRFTFILPRASRPSRFPPRPHETAHGPC